MILEPWLARPRFSLISNEILLKHLPFWISGWPGEDFHWFLIKSVLETYHFESWLARPRFSLICIGALAGQARNINDLWRPGWASLDFSLISNYVNPYQTPTVLEPWLAKTKFPLISNYILIRNLPFWSPGWPGLDFIDFQLITLLQTYDVGALADQA